MNRIAAAVTAFLVLMWGIGHASPAAAVITWDFTNAPFTLSNGSGSTANVTVQHMQVTGSSATGYVRVSDSAGRYTCYSQNFSAMTVTWFDGSFSPCSGTVTFAVDPTGVLRISDSGLLIASGLFTGAGSGSAQGIAQAPVVVPLLNCTASTDVTAQEITIEMDR